MGMYGTNSLNEIFRGKVSIIPKVENGEQVKSETDNVTGKVLDNVLNRSMKGKSIEMHNKLFSTKGTDVMSKITGKGFENNDFMSKMNGFNNIRKFNNTGVEKRLFAGLNTNKFSNDKLHSLIGGHTNVKFNDINKLQSLIGGSSKGFSNIGFNSGMSKENQVWANLKPNLGIRNDVVSFNKKTKIKTYSQEELPDPSNISIEYPTSTSDTLEKVGEGISKGAKYVGGKVVQGAKYVGGIVAESIPTKDEVVARIKENREINRQIKLAKRGIGQKYSIRESEDKQGNITRSYIPLEGKDLTPEAQKAIAYKRKQDMDFQDALRRKEAGIGMGVSSGIDPALMKELIKQGGKKKGGLTEAQVNAILAMNRGSSQPQSSTNKFVSAVTSGLPGSPQGIAYATRGAVMMPGNPEAMQGAIGNVGGSWGQIQQATQLSNSGSRWDNIKRATEIPTNTQNMTGVDKIRWMTAPTNQKEAILKEIQERQLIQQPVQQMQQPVQPQIQQLEEQPIEQSRNVKYSPYSKKPVTYIRGPYSKN